MSMRKKAPMPLDILRSKVRKDGSDILALKAAVADMQARLTRLERRDEMPPNVEREDTRAENEQEGG